MIYKNMEAVIETLRSRMLDQGWDSQYDDDGMTYYAVIVYGALDLYGTVFGINPEFMDMMEESEFMYYSIAQIIEYPPGEHPPGFTKFTFDIYRK